MRAVIQRATSGEVRVDGKVVGKCEHGLLILLGVANGDTEAEAETLAAKASKLRIFEDDNGKMNLSVADVGGSILLVSQFTLLANCQKGNRPDYFGAASPSEADRLYEYFGEKLRETGLHVETGIFGADMKVRFMNDGPVTIILDSDDLKKKKVPVATAKGE